MKKSNQSGVMSAGAGKQPSGMPSSSADLGKTENLPISDTSGISVQLNKDYLDTTKSENPNLLPVRMITAAAAKLRESTKWVRVRMNGEEGFALFFPASKWEKVNGLLTPLEKK